MFDVFRPLPELVFEPDARQEGVSNLCGVLLPILGYIYVCTVWEFRRTINLDLGCFLVSFVVSFSD